MSLTDIYEIYIGVSMTESLNPLAAVIGVAAGINLYMFPVS